MRVVTRNISDKSASIGHFRVVSRDPDGCLSLLVECFRLGHLSATDKSEFHSCNGEFTPWASLFTYILDYE